MTPDLMPLLAAGSHTNPREGACVMEYVSLLAGEPWSDSPSCTHPVLASLARSVNDRLSDDDRHLLVPLIGRLFGTAETGTPLERRVLSVRLAVWSAKQVQHLASSQDAGVVAKAIRCAEAWADEPNAADAAAYAAYAADAAAYASADATAIATAATAADADATKPLVGLLTGLLDEYDRLTGRTQVQPDAAQKAQLAYLNIVAAS